jgi:hypothetical protein
MLEIAHKTWQALHPTNPLGEIIAPTMNMSYSRWKGYFGLTSMKQGNVMSLFV